MLTEFDGGTETQTVTISYYGQEICSLVAVWEGSDLRFSDQVYPVVVDAVEAARRLAGLPRRSP